MQTVLKFRFTTSIDVDSRDAEKRYLKMRAIINAIRRGISQNLEASKQTEHINILHGLIGRNQTMQHIQSAEAITKWFGSLDASEPNNNSATGDLSLLVESDVEVHIELLKQLIILSAQPMGVHLTFIAYDTVYPDYELSDVIHTYAIEAFLHPILSRNKERGDRKAQQALVKKLYPLGNDPQSKNVLSESCGEAVKRHLIKSAQYHGLDTEHLKNTVFAVQACWIGLPVKDAFKHANRKEACRVLFQSTVDLQGCWSAGSYRHKGMGQITRINRDMCAGFNGAIIL